MSRSRILAAIAAGALFTAAPHGKAPWFVWNTSPSVPLGLYRIDPGPVRRSDLVLTRLPADVAELAERCNYLPKSTYLIKFVFAVAGDQVCRLGDRIFVRGGLVGRAFARDGLGRPMPSWQGCRQLASGDLFLLADDQQSFDSRYFGVVSLRATSLAALYDFGYRAAAVNPTLPATSCRHSFERAHRRTDGCYSAGQDKLMPVETSKHKTTDECSWCQLFMRLGLGFRDEFGRPPPSGSKPSGGSRAIARRKIAARPSRLWRLVPFG